MKGIVDRVANRFQMSDIPRSDNHNGRSPNTLISKKTDSNAASSRKHAAMIPQLSSMDDGDDVASYDRDDDSSSPTKSSNSPIAYRLRMPHPPFASSSNRRAPFPIPSSPSASPSKGASSSVTTAAAIVNASPTMGAAAAAAAAARLRSQNYPSSPSRSIRDRDQNASSDIRSHHGVVNYSNPDVNRIVTSFSSSSSSSLASPSSSAPCCSPSPQKDVLGKSSSIPANYSNSSNYPYANAVASSSPIKSISGPSFHPPANQHGSNIVVVHPSLSSSSSSSSFPSSSSSSPAAAAAAGASRSVLATPPSPRTAPLSSRANQPLTTYNSNNSSSSSSSNNINAFLWRRKREAVTAESPSNKGKDAGGDDVVGGKESRMMGEDEGTPDSKTSFGQFPVFPKPPEIAAILLGALRPLLLLEDLTTSALETLVAAMAPVRVNAGTVVVVQGDPNADCLYVVTEGVLDVFVEERGVNEKEKGEKEERVASMMKKRSNGDENGREEKTLQEDAAVTMTNDNTPRGNSNPPKRVKICIPGDCFGELALMYHSPRAATVRARIPCTLWSLSRTHVTSQRRRHTREAHATRRKLIDSVPSLLALSDDQKDLLADALTPARFSSGSTVFRKGDSGTAFYMVREGRAIVRDGPRVLATLGPGQFFGEKALITGEPRNADVVADPSAPAPLDCLCLTSHVFASLLGSATEVWRHLTLSKASVLAPLSDSQLWILARAATEKSYRRGDVVFRLGDPGHECFFVQSGAFTVFDLTGKELARVGEGGFFGEKALLNNEPRAATVMALTESKCLSVGKQQFDLLLGGLTVVRHLWRLEALKKVPLLSRVDGERRGRLAEALRARRIEKGMDVVREGEMGDEFFIVERGSLGVFRGEVEGDDAGSTPKPLKVYGCGEYFGELALLGDLDSLLPSSASSSSSPPSVSSSSPSPSPPSVSSISSSTSSPTSSSTPTTISSLSRRLATVRALTDCDLLSLDRRSFHALLADLLPQMAQDAKEYLRKGGEEAAARAAAAEQKTSRERRSKLGPPTFDVSKCEALAVLGAGGFGQVLLVRYPYRFPSRHDSSSNSNPGFSNPSPNSSNPSPNSSNPNPNNSSNSSSSSSSRSLPPPSSNSSSSSSSASTSTQPPFLQSVFALKCMSKAFVVEQQLVAHVIREKNLMAQCHSPFLVYLMGASQDPSSLYMLQEAVLGGELFAYLQRRGRPLEEHHARFYAAGVCLALEYLHSQHLVYRDLKPENLLLDLDGYIKVADFGFVKEVKKGSKTYTLCGTPEYLAPEVILSRGHGAPADWWAFGVLLYELCAGQPPFQDPSGDRMLMFRRACARRIEFPAHFSEALRNLIDRLLTVNPLFRMGSGRDGAGEIRKHPWFRDLDWIRFAERSLAAPYQPRKPAVAAEANCNFPNVKLPPDAFKEKPFVDTRGDFKMF